MIGKIESIEGLTGRRNDAYDSAAFSVHTRTHSVGDDLCTDMDGMGSLRKQDLADRAIAAGEDEQAMFRVVHAMPVIQLRERQ